MIGGDGIPLVFYRCKKCRREFSSRAEAAACEKAHLRVKSAKVKNHGIYEYPYSLDVTFNNGETREYVADHMR